MRLSDNAPKELRIEADDKFIVSYPRSGQTWIRSLLTAVRYPDLDWTDKHVDYMIPDFRRATPAERFLMKRPRIFKSHEYYNPRYKNVVYIVRDVRAVALSLWNWRSKMAVGNKWRYEGKFDLLFIEQFIEGKIFPGSYKEHYHGWLAPETKINIEVFYYEDFIINTHKWLGYLCNELKIDVPRNKIFKIFNAIEAFPPGKPGGVLKASIKPYTASAFKWREYYTKEMLIRMNKSFKIEIEDGRYEI